jgi:hypothetical protein
MGFSLMFWKSYINYLSLKKRISLYEDKHILRYKYTTNMVSLISFVKADKKGLKRWIHSD